MTRMVSLAGPWSCRLDPDHRGVHDAWQDGTVEEHTVLLPGTTQTNDIGPPYAAKLIGNLTPNTEHLGPAWYWRDIQLSQGDCQNNIEISLERVSWESFVWLNGTPLGTRDSLVSPHVYDLAPAAKPGVNRLTIMVDNSNVLSKTTDGAAKMTEDEELIIEASAERRLHCGGHHTSFGGLAWNGITGRMVLRIQPRIRLACPQVYPDVARKRVTVKCGVTNNTPSAAPATVTLEVDGQCIEQTMSLEPGQQLISVEVDLQKKLRLWSPHHPELYHLTIRLESDQGVDQQQTTFGMRNLSSVENRFAINGRPVFLRGALEKFVHPITGYPPTDVLYWLKIFGVHKAHGLNHLRFHSCCPPQAAFEAADQLGLVLNIELPGASGGETTDDLTQHYLQDEALRILDAFGNHPSFCMLTMGNEVLDDEVAQADGQARLMQRVARCRAHDPRHWYCSTAHAYTPGRDDDFYVTAWPNGPTAADRHRGAPLRGFRWNGDDVVDDSRFNTHPPETASDYRAGIAGIDKPIITHEVGMWAVYPDISEAPRFSGVLKPFNLEIIRDFMEAKGTLSLAADFVKASGALSLLLYKEEIEAALRTPGLSGLQLLGIHDHPPQGTSTIGIVTALREEKGIVAPARFREFCSDTVPLARLEKRTFTSDESLTATVEVAHYGMNDLSGDQFTWHLLSEAGDQLQQGRFTEKNIPCGALTPLGTIATALNHLPAPAKLRLEVVVEGAQVQNGWDCWVYPPSSLDQPESVIWANAWSTALAEAVKNGQTAVLELGRDQIPCATRGCFTTLLWNPIMKRKHHSQTMGILCDPSHPVFCDFPTDAHTNWQWWDVIQPSLVLNLDGMDSQPEPLVRMVDAFIGNRHLSPLFEARMGKGRLIVTSFDLSHNLSSRHAARQLRQSLLGYAVSEHFDPSVSISSEDLARLIAAHQKERIIPSRAEIYARFDRPVIRTRKGL